MAATTRRIETEGITPPQRQVSTEQSCSNSSFMACGFYSAGAFCSASIARSLTAAAAAARIITSADYNMLTRSRSIILSDLAPFVAEVLRDKVVDDLNEEVKDQREEIDAFDEVRVEGTDATTGETVVYARANMRKKGRLREFGPNFLGTSWVVFLKQENVCPLENIGSLKVFFGNVFTNIASTPHTGCTRLEEENVNDDGQGWFDLSLPAASMSTLGFRAGPFDSNEQYHAVGPGNRAFPCHDLAQLGNTQPGMSVALRYMCFSLKHVQKHLGIAYVPTELTANMS